MASRHSGRSAAWVFAFAVMALALALVGYLSFSARPEGGPAAMVKLPSPRLPALPDPQPIPLPRPVPAG